MAQTFLQNGSPQIFFSFYKPECAVNLPMSKWCSCPNSTLAWVFATNFRKTFEKNTYEMQWNLVVTEGIEIWNKKSIRNLFLRMVEPGTWNLTPGTCRLDTWHLLDPGTWHLEPDTWNLAPAFWTWHLAHGPWNLAPRTWQLEPGTWHLRFEPADLSLPILIKTWRFTKIRFHQSAKLKTDSITDSFTASYSKSIKIYQKQSLLQP